MLLTLANPAFIFSVFVVSVLSSKFNHLYIHSADVAPLELVFYLPTILLHDIIIILMARVLLQRDRGRLSFLKFLAGISLTLFTLAAAALQLAFFHQTGAELRWRDAGSFAYSRESLKVLLSGSTALLVSAMMMLAVSWMLQSILYGGIGRAGHQTVVLLTSGRDSRLYAGLRGFLRASGYSQRLLPIGKDIDHLHQKEASKYRWNWTWILLQMMWLLAAFVVRPPTPYNHISTTLPILALSAFHPSLTSCAEWGSLAENQWPLPHLLDEAFWLEPRNGFKGWAPGLGSQLAMRYWDRRVDWFPTPAPEGFSRWDPSRRGDADLKQAAGSEYVGRIGQQNETKSRGGTCQATGGWGGSFYNPVSDPLKISNLQEDILQPMQEAIGNGSVKIQNIVLILMESMRQELFPIQQGTDIHRYILESHQGEEAQDEINRRVSRLTPNSERITGKVGGFLDASGRSFDADRAEWNDQTDAGLGGINVVGAFSPSSVSLKSVASSHCGVWPMAVDMFEEAEAESYQPCLPQILSLFNQRKKGGEPTPDDFRGLRWRSAFFQAVTDTYDRQNVFDDKIGFAQTIARSRIKEDSHGDPDMTEINYFGYADTSLKQYIDDFIGDVTAHHERMFLSHFTSTTHHPWATPAWFNTTTYMGARPDTGMHQDMDRYLNTIRFHDAWLGMLMQLFDDHGISNQTLVVFAGDHGQAFGEDADVTGTYENGHVSNFRIPITFRHPRLPRYQYEANATTISILPTILDLLITTGSLDAHDTTVASDIVQDYQGQSLIRPYVRSQHGRRAWNFGIVNPGGGLITVTSADAPWRLTMPLEKEMPYLLTDLRGDPLELAPISTWSLDRLLATVRSNFGEAAARWAAEAEAVAGWFSLETRRLWRYHLT